MSVPKTDALPLGDAPTGAVPTPFVFASQHDVWVKEKVVEALEQYGARSYNAATSRHSRIGPAQPEVTILTEYSAAW